MTMNLHHDGIRKAAILVDCLDRDAADHLLEQMDPKSAQLVRHVMVELDEVDPAEQRRVIDEFLHVKPMVPDKMVPDKEPPGIELDITSSGPGPFSSQTANPSETHDPPASETAGYEKTTYEKPASQPTGDARFQLLREAEADKLARILTLERSQTIALVLSHLPPEQAGSVLERLPAGQQTEVIHRLVDLEETDTEVLAEVEQALESRLSEHIHMQRRRVAGLSAVAGILEATGNQAGMRILDNLASRDRELAETLGPQPLEFDELVRLDTTSLSAVLEAAGQPLLTLALVGSPAELAEQFLAVLHPTKTDRIRHKLGAVGPIRLGDVTEARRRIAQLAMRMATGARIRWPRVDATSIPSPKVLQPAA